LQIHEIEKSPYLPYNKFIIAYYDEDMKIISWNVNGLRAITRKGALGTLLRQEKPDIIGLQEIKITSHQASELDFGLSDYDTYWNGALRPGYSGTALLVKKGLDGLKKVTAGFGLAEFDTEGRVQTADLAAFYLLNIYFPNANQELSRLDYKLAFNRSLLSYVRKLEKIKPVVITGDFNVAHQPIDLARPKENEGSAGFTPEERAWFDKLSRSGFVDTFRFIHPNKIQYSWWSYRGGARFRNVGWRIDYFCVATKLKGKIKKAYILDKILGSDHAPVGLEL